MKLVIHNVVIDGCAGDAFLFQDLPRGSEAVLGTVRLSGIQGRAFAVEYPSLRHRLVVPEVVSDEDLEAAICAAREQPKQNALAIIQNLTSVATLGNAAFDLAEKIVKHFQG